jgi:hypothetical protein
MKKKTWLIFVLVLLMIFGTFALIATAQRYGDPGDSRTRDRVGPPSTEPQEPDSFPNCFLKCMRKYGPKGDDYCTRLCGPKQGN